MHSLEANPTTGNICRAIYAYRTLDNDSEHCKFWPLRDVSEVSFSQQAAILCLKASCGHTGSAQWTRVVLGCKVLLLTAGSVDWKGRSRAVPQAVATCLCSRMLLPWPDARRSCFFSCVFEHNHGYFYPCPFYMWIPGKASTLSPYKDYRHLDNNKLRNGQALAVWF